MRLAQGIKLSVALLFSVFLASCASSSIRQSHVVTLNPNTPILVVPFYNNSDTPNAGQRAGSLLLGLLEAKGMRNVQMYRVASRCENPLTCGTTTIAWKSIQSWASANQIHYVFMGDVNEWRYKVGLDGEPSVGVMINLKDVDTGRTLWTAVGSQVGHSWSGLSNTAQQLFQKLLITIQR